jgi:hypothetical protein
MRHPVASNFSADDEWENKLLFCAPVQFVAKAAVLVRMGYRLDVKPHRETRKTGHIGF